MQLAMLIPITVSVKAMSQHNFENWRVCVINFFSDSKVWWNMIIRWYNFFFLCCTCWLNFVLKSICQYRLAKFLISLLTWNTMIWIPRLAIFICASKTAINFSVVAFFIMHCYVLDVIREGYAFNQVLVVGKHMSFSIIRLNNRCKQAEVAFDVNQL